MYAGVSLQARMLVESRTANHRAVAIGFIDDLSNRILLNRDAALANNYAMAWSDPNILKDKNDCIASVCIGADLAKYDLKQWLLALNAALPNANANIFPSTTAPRQIGIAVAWSANERITDKTDKKYNKPFEVKKTGVLGTNCPADSICHVVYVQP